MSTINHCTVIKAPHCYKTALSKATLSVFLAGSIEMGKASDWQQQFTEALQSSANASTGTKSKTVETELSEQSSLLILNPRREAWDSSWEQSIDNSQFRNQVEWELDALESSDVIVMYLVPDTKSPISLLELGLFAKSKKMICCCPDGFWRKGNVDVVCKKYGVEVVSDLEGMIQKVKQKLHGK